MLRTYAWQAILEYFLPNLLGNPEASFTGSRAAVLLVLVYDFLPFMIMPLYNTLAKLDKSLIEASRDLGATGVQTFTRVVLPLSVPGIVSGITMVFVPAITAFTVPALIGNGTFYLYGNIIEETFHSPNSGPLEFAAGSTLSIILLVCVLVSTIIMNHFDKDQQKEGQLL